jgi:Smr domain
MELARILDHDILSSSTFTRNPDIQLKLGVKTYSPINKSEPRSPSVIDDGEGSFEDMTDLKSHYLAKRNEAFAAASNAYRQSKSDSLHSGVAAYYGSLGREYDSKYRRYSHLAANRLVASKSSLNQIDLHGVSVKDALRLVEEGVTAWWARIGVIRERGEIKAVENFVVVVGRGERHKGGSRLGPAVAHWLRRNGWGFTETEGALIVWGIRKNVGKGSGG